MSQQHIFLSPHHDDICLSLACTVRASGGGELLNLFSRSGYVAAPYEPLLNTAPSDTAYHNPLAVEHRAGDRTELVSQVRRREDQSFCSRVGLKRQDLDLDDALIRGHEPFTYSTAELAADADRVARVLHPILQDMVRGNGSEATTLFCPMGIGGHRDHLACLQAVLGMPIELHRQLRLQFYEDLHYSSDPEARQQGLARFIQLLKPARMVKVPLRLTAANMNWKMQLIHLYNSQHYHPISMWDYTPADSNQWGPHEALWVEA